MSEEGGSARVLIWAALITAIATLGVPLITNLMSHFTSGFETSSGAQSPSSHASAGLNGAPQQTSPVATSAVERERACTAFAAALTREGNAAIAVYHQIEADRAQKPRQLLPGYESAVKTFDKAVNDSKGTVETELTFRVARFHVPAHPADKDDLDTVLSDIQGLPVALGASVPRGSGSSDDYGALYDRGATLQRISTDAIIPQCQH